MTKYDKDKVDAIIHKNMPIASFLGVVTFFLIWGISNFPLGAATGIIVWMIYHVVSVIIDLV